MKYIRYFRLRHRKFTRRFVELLKSRKGISLVGLIMMMVIMSVMGGVFSSMMGKWQSSAPATINAAKAYYLAETAAMFALQDAKYRFFGGSFNYGTSGSTYTVYSSTTESAEYWFERPGSGYEDDDATTGTDDDDVDDDADDASATNRYTIIATGKVLRGGSTVAKRQIKIKADITDWSSAPIEPGVHTDGSINGSGANSGNCFGITDGTNTVGYGSPGTWNYVSPYTIADESGLIYRSTPALDKNAFKALATDQGHYYSADVSVADGYPNGSSYYTGSVPNITYIEGSTSDLTVLANRTAWGIYYVEGDVTLGGNGSEVQGVVICEGTITLNGTASITGGIIHMGATINGNGNPAAINVLSGPFDDLNATLVNLTVVSCQEAVSNN